MLAYLHTYALQPKANTLYIPLSNLPRADLQLRPELLPVLRYAGLKPGDLITLSDLPPIARPLKANSTRWLLVDHNSLQRDLGKLYSSRVVGCIDHHDEEGKVPLDCGDEPRIIKKSGSCASLVVEHCRRAWDAEQKRHALDHVGLARLALAPILIDTTNLTAESKTTQADIDAVRYLESWIGTSPETSFTSKDYFEEIQHAKEDIGGLSLPDILRKDYKEWTEGSFELGISCVVQNIHFLVDKAGSKEAFFEGLESFAMERNLSVFSIMTTSNTNNEFQRELLLWADEKGMKFAEKFVQSADETLGLVEFEDALFHLVGNTRWRRCWRQTEVQNSRKQVAPLMRAALR